MTGQNPEDLPSDDADFDPELDEQLFGPLHRLEPPDTWQRVTSPPAGRAEQPQHRLVAFAAAACLLIVGLVAVSRVNRAPSGPATVSDAQQVEPAEQADQANQPSATADVQRSPAPDCPAAEEARGELAAWGWSDAEPPAALTDDEPLPEPDIVVTGQLIGAFADWPTVEGKPHLQFKFRGAELTSSSTVDVPPTMLNEFGIAADGAIGSLRFEGDRSVNVTAFLQRDETYASGWRVVKGGLVLGCGPWNEPTPGAEAQPRVFDLQLDDGTRIALRMPSIVGPDLSLSYGGGEGLLAELHDGDTLSGALFFERNTCHGPDQPDDLLTARGLRVTHVPYPGSDSFEICDLTNGGSLILGIKGDDALADHLEEFDIFPLVCGPSITTGERWDTTCNPGLHGPREVSQASSGELVLFSASYYGGVVTALDTGTAREVWSTNVGTESLFDGLAADVILVGSDTAFQALDPATGEVRWAIPFPDGAGLIHGADVVDGVVHFALSFRGDGHGEDMDERAPLLIAADVETGRELWRAQGGIGEDWTWDEIDVVGDRVLALSLPMRLAKVDQVKVWVFDRATGEVIAAAEVGESSGALGGEDRAMVVTEQGDVYVALVSTSVARIDPVDGRVIWQNPIGMAAIEAVTDDGVRLHHDETGVDDLVPDFNQTTWLDLETGQRR